MIMTKKIKFPIGLPLSIFILFGFFAFGAPVSAMTCSSATLAGNVITGTPPTHARFEYSTSYNSVANGGGTTTAVQYFYSDGTFPIQQFISGLSPSTTYYYRLVVTNNYETQGLNIESFTTPACNQPIPPTQNPTASITSTSSCAAPCNVNLSWTSNNIPNLIKIYRNGTFLWNRTANLQNDNEVDWDQPVGTYTYCIRSIDNNWSESGNLACSTTNVTATVVAPPVPQQTPTASINSTPTCTAPCNVNLTFTSNNVPNLIKIYRNGTFLWNRTANLQNDNEVDWDQPVGTYTYCIRSIDNNWFESGNLACSTTNVTATVVAPPVIVPPLLTMSGILTPASYSCVISTGQNSCNINFSWNTTNPVAVSAVTSSSGTMANGNSSSASFAIPFGSKTFYLYNNAILLDQKTVSANCSSGKTWNGNICQTAPVVVPPVVNPPSYNPPSYNPPTYNPPSYNPPVYNPPTYNPPVYNVYNPPTYNPTPQIVNPTVSLAADNINLTYNGNTILRWSSNNATSCNANNGTNGWAGNKSTSGNFYTGNLPNTTTYSITCSNSGGQQTYDSVTINVNNQQIYTQSSITTNNATNITTSSATLNGTVGGNSFYSTAWFEYGTNTNLGYTTSQNSYNSVFSNYSSPISGLLPNTIYYFRAVAQSSQGIIYGNILSFNTTNNFVFVNNQPTVTISADDTNLAFNGATFIRWYTTNAASCFASSGSVGWAGTKSIGPASFYTGSLTANRTYTIVCSNNFGTTSDSVTVSVRAPVVTAITSRPAPTSLVLITSSVDRNQPIVPTIDNTRPHPGDEINYTVSYQNIGTGAITNLSLRIILPIEVDYLFSNPNNPTVFGSTLIFNLGTLKANGQGTVTARVRVQNNIPAGANLNFPAILSYTDPSGQSQSVNANVYAQVWSEPTEDVSLGANVLGAGFFPENIFSWLLLLVLILILILLTKYLFTTQNKYVITPVVDNEFPQKNTISH